MNLDKIKREIKSCTEFKKFIDNPYSIENQDRVIELIYNITVQESFNEGRDSMKKEWKWHSKNQKKQMNALNKIAKSLNIKL